MLSPSWPGSAWLLVAVFVAMIVFLGLRARRRDRREFRRFKNYRSTVRRQEMMRKWLRDSFLTFGGLAVVLLLLAWQYIPLLLEAACALEPIDVETWFDTVRRSAPFATLPRSAFEATLDLLAGRLAVQFFVSALAP